MQQKWPETILTLLDPAQSLKVLWDSIGYFIMAAALAGALYVGVRKGKRDERSAIALERANEIQPFKDAADGWRARCQQLQDSVNEAERKLDLAEKARQKIIDEHELLKESYIITMQTNQRQQGEIDELRRKVTEIGNLKDLIVRTLAEMKG